MAGRHPICWTDIYAEDGHAMVIQQAQKIRGLRLITTSSDPCVNRRRWI